MSYPSQRCHSKDIVCKHSYLSLDLNRMHASIWGPIFEPGCLYFLNGDSKLGFAYMIEPDDNENDRLYMG